MLERMIEILRGRSVDRMKAREHLATQSSAIFHEVMRELCGNPKLKKITEQLELQLVRILFRSIQEQNDVEQWTSHHDEILQAILAGDSAKAAELTSAYARENRELIRSLPDWLFD